MAKLNMVNMNTLFRKGYLLAGVIMAANMFVVNEVKAMKLSNNHQKANPTYTDDNEDIEEQTKDQKKKKRVVRNKTKKKYSEIGGGNKVREKYRRSETGLTIKNLENAINLIGGTVSSVANNYFKLWDYNPGWYRQFGCLGWRSKRFLNGVLQFEVNFNLGRGALWSIPHIINLYIIKRSKGKKKDNDFSWVGFFFSDILRGFTSMPLTFHISKFNFSISISLDSIIWWGIIDNILKLSGKKKMKEKKDKDKKALENMQEPIDMNEEKKDDKKEEKKDEGNKKEPKVEIIQKEPKPEEEKKEENNNNNNNNKS